MIRTQRLLISLTLINFALLIFLLAQVYRVKATEVAPVLRGRALEIVDGQDRIRAQILVHGPETVNAVTYPETVLFRMADPKSGPVVKMTASEEGAALGFSDDGNGAVQLYANRRKGNYVRVVSRDGKEQMIKP